jgi:hypothetical protein
MTVQTADTGLIHFALHKRAIDKDLIEYLSVAVIIWWINQCRQVVVEQIIAVMFELGCEHLASGMTAATLIHDPLRIVASQHFQLQIIYTWIKSRRTDRLDMVFPRAMTGLTADIDFGNSGGVTVVGQIKVFLHRCAVTICAHTVPVFAALSPMHPFRRLCFQFWLRIKPLLSPCIPRYGQLL